MSLDASWLQSELVTLGRIAVAMVLGAFIGIEREHRDRPAGLRTHMLVSGAAALFVILGLDLIESYRSSVGVDPLRADPIRILEAIATAIAFLGAGTIIRSGPDSVTGLTTAASLLLSAAVGMSVALSRWVLAVGIVLLALLALALLRRLEDRLRQPERGGEPDG